MIKADVQGSLEPILSSLNDFNAGDIKINILHKEIGNIGENDIMLAAASKAIVIGFNVQADAPARRLAEAEGVSIRLYDIIYRLLEDVEKALKGMLEPEVQETILGHAEVRAVFRISKVGNIAGCRVVDGEIRRNARIRLKRKGTMIYEGEISSLKHLQENASEVRAGFDCGIGIKNFTDIAEGDILESFILREGTGVLKGEIKWFLMQESVRIAERMREELSELLIKDIQDPVSREYRLPMLKWIVSLLMRRFLIHDRRVISQRGNSCRV